MSIAGETVLFLDTCSLLHYPPIKDVDWKAVCGTKAVRLVLCMQVVHELDSKKDHPRLSNRAMRVIKEVDVILEADGAVDDGVTLEVFEYEIRNLDFPDTLSPDSKDDRIVHSAKKYLEKHADADASVYSEDMGMRLRCRANAVALLKPDAATRQPDPTSEEDRKYKIAISELHELKNRTPKVELVISKTGAIAPHKDELVFELPRPPTPRNTNAEFDEYVKNYNLWPMAKGDLARGGIIPSLPPQQDAVERYNADLRQHLDAIKDWLRFRSTWDIVNAHTVGFVLWLKNDGSCPAEDLDVEIELPNTLFQVVEANSPEARRLVLPKRPKPPIRPSQLFTDLGSLLRHELSVPTLIASDLPEVHLDRALVTHSDENGGFRVKCSIHRLKHGHFKRLGDMIAIIRPDSVRPFQAHYRITAANLIKPVTSDLQFIVRPGQHRPPQEPAGRVE